MRVFSDACASAIVMAILAGPVSAQAPSPPPPDAQALRADIEELRREFEAVRQQYGERLAALEAKLGAIEGSPPAAAAATPATPASPSPNQPPAAPETVQVPAGAAGPGGSPGALPVYGNAAANTKVFNPDIAVIGDFLGAAGTNDVQPDAFGPGTHPAALQMHESEASFQAVVDPYARGDFFLSFGEEGVDLEEGYLTFTSLPGGLLTKVGKLRAAFGKVNTFHNHMLPWTDRPIVAANLVAGEEGISDAGLSVARLIPNPWLFLEVTGQMFRGDAGPDERPLFRTARRADVSFVGHLRGYHDLTENTNIDFGVSTARGHNPAGVIDGVDVGRFWTTLYGVDLTYRWRPLARAIYHSFVGRAEHVWSRRDQFNGRQASTGYYVSGDYQFARRWFAGVRFDRSDRADNALLADKGASLVLTYWPSEFSQIRGQYRHTRYAEGPTANELLFQFQFSIGAHGAHPF